MYNGILPVYKERGLTSHDVVFKLRKILKTKKIGHTGTLDPEVSGVLPVCIGTATRVSDYVMDMGKSYNATIDVQANAININEVDAVLKQFEGIIEQVPPMYSSVKVNGKKLYEYARKGETVERPIRKVNIDSIARTSELQFEDGKCHFNIEVKCGKGTYIRTLATDIGKQLGYPAHMSLLTRINSGGFDIKYSITL
ncbi:tRNA pseudouridine(55) synthase TruB, partial [Staphylococcus aureus]|uniref:tRNA pseudouridine synthase B n=1 Tax=Staphylococcus aureus TaxID=1280 RepID=UPI0030F3B029